MGEDWAQVSVKFGVRSGRRAPVSGLPVQRSALAARFQLYTNHCVGLVTLLCIRGKHRDVRHVISNKQRAFVIAADSIACADFFYFWSPLKIFYHY